VWASAETLNEAWNWGWGITMRCLDDDGREEAHRDQAVDLAMPKYRIRKDHFLQDPERGLPPMQMEPLDEERAPRWRGGRKELELRCRTWKRTRLL